MSALTLSEIIWSMQLISPELVNWVSQKSSLTWWPSIPPWALSPSMAATTPAWSSGSVTTWEVSGAMLPTTMGDDDEALDADEALDVDDVLELCAVVLDELL